MLEVVNKMASRNKPDGYWLELDNAIDQAKVVIDKYDLSKLPNGKRLHELGHSDLKYAIEVHHGGMRRFRQTLGESQDRTAKGMWKDIDFVNSKYDEMMKLHSGKKFPTTTEMDNYGYSDLRLAIQRYHGGVGVYSEQVGIPTIQRKRGIWKDRNFVLEQAVVFMDEHKFDELPSTKVLHSFGNGILGSSIVRYHGGMTQFREVLRNHMGVESKEDKLRSMLEEYVGEKDEY